MSIKRLLISVGSYVASNVVANAIDKQFPAQSKWVPYVELAGGIGLAYYGQKNNRPFITSVGMGVAVSGGLRLVGVDLGTWVADKWQSISTGAPANNAPALKHIPNPSYNPKLPAGPSNQPTIPNAQDIIKQAQSLFTSSTAADSIPDDTANNTPDLTDDSSTELAGTW